MRLIKFILPVIIFCLGLPACASGDSSAPILILATNAGFGTYTGEILKAEGFNEYIIDSLSGKKTTLNYLRRFDVVILSETAVTPELEKIFSRYVKSGGNLIAFRPDKRLCEIFGITESGGTVKEGYIKINTKGVEGKGLAQATIQFHGESDLYKLNGATAIAGLYYDAARSSDFPAVVSNDLGEGHAAAFTYNLPKSIVYTRQGNPEWAGEERDKVDGPTATDLFFPGTGEKQWNDPGKIALPQADEQMRLLSHIIERFTGYRKPIPRFWYFPDKCRCIFIFTIDGEDTPEWDIDNEITEVNSSGARATLYEIGTYIRAETINRWLSNGNEVAIHYNDVPNYANPTWINMKTVLDTMTAKFRDTYGIKPGTVRNHWVVWCSKDSLGKKQFAAQAIIEETFGLGMDCNYYQFGGNKVYPNWLGDVGHFNGSGIPMKFADSRGKILNIYQSNTQLPDETWLKENIANKSRILIDRSVDEENFTYINANFHTWYWNECRIPGLSILDYCNSRGVPVWTVQNVYEFLKMKDEAGFSDFTWAKNKLTFRLLSTLKHQNGLTFLLPVKHSGLKIRQITVNGHEQHFEQQTIKGYDYALITVSPGKSYEVSASYQKL